ncbi:conserved protein of unknown function [Pseudorhizobium banfieldiae]|uniref:Uncharacterized protein n=1 Tax=Pseudorhizobium banfieldiae TaxID=1125847 RepID=L0NFW5_9HYPH|nr:hypothetical protein RNT25_02618 [arsenite-oxidising bacterium NT-25]CCF19993.1 conserved protein of unknown function [Pseudorhizobium banfieldiae]
MSDSDCSEWLGQGREALVAQLRRLADDLETIGRLNWPPSDAVYINDWFVGRRAVSCLVGRPLGHPFIDNGHPMVSSELFFMDVDHGYARSFSRWYRLGTQIGDADDHNRRRPQ